MSYYQNREALVMIMSELVEKGWKVFGYKADESDSMTDYFSPSSWQGIASKNGYVLVIDNNNTRLSGYEVKKYNYNKTSYKASDRIVKLEAMMNDAASTENEKASCAELIKKEQQKQGIAPTYTVEEFYPTFAHGNPKHNNWHIEKDGQIVAKGSGAFAVNSYDWENEEKTAAEQKAEKLAKFIAKIEKILTDSDALKAEVVKVAKTVVKPVQKEESTINEGDILSFSYQGGFWIVNSVYDRSGKIAVVYEQLGSAKRGYQRTKNGKRYYQYLDKLQSGMAEGKVKVYTIQEVKEYVEKTVFTKTKRTQKASNAVQIESNDPVEEHAEEAAEAVKSETVNAEAVTSTTEGTATLTINNDKNGIEIAFTSKPSTNVIEALKENGFRWSKFSKVWWTKQTADRLKFAQMFVDAYNSIKTEEPAPAQEKAEVEMMQESITDTEETNHSSDSMSEPTETQDNVIYHNFINNNVNIEQEESEPMTTVFDDILSKFDNVEVTTESKIPVEDIEFCKREQEQYDAAIELIIKLANEIKIASGMDILNKEWHREKSSNPYLDNYKLKEIKLVAVGMKESFIDKIVYWFRNKYNVTIKTERMHKNHDYNITYENIIDDIYLQLDGFSFTEKAVSELLNKTKNTYHYNEYRKHSNMDIKNSKVVIDGSFAYRDTIWNEYRLRGGFDDLFSALYLFDTGSIPKEKTELHNRYCGYQNERNVNNYDRFEPITLSKVVSIKFFKNGKLEIEFKSNYQATIFAKEYLGFKKVSA